MQNLRARFQGGRDMRFRVLVAGVVLLVVASGLFAVRAMSRPAQPSSASTAQTRPQDPVGVSVAAAQRADVVSRILAVGSVTSIRDAKIGSKISGRVAAVLVEEGARVAVGTPLLQLDTSDLLAQQAQAQANVAAARAQLQKVLTGARPQERQQSADAVNQAHAALISAQASLKLAQANLERMRSLQSQGAVSQQDLDSAETQASVAQAQVAQAQAAYDSTVQNAALVRIGSRDEDIQQARAQLAQAQAGLALVQVQLHDSTLSAPFSGTITQRSVEPGETVSSMSAPSNNPLFILSQVDDVYVEFIVPAQHRSELQPGQEAVMEVDGLPGQRVQGRIQEIRPAAEAASRTFGVKVRVPNPKGTLRPGMFARGAIITGVRHAVLSVPEQAVLTATSGPVVFVVRDGRAIRQAVALGAHHDGLVEVTSGLTEGDQVIVEGQDALTDNQPVAPRTP
jgi:HlyD family secretion protein